MGVDVYPGVWPTGTGQPYADMVTFLEDARYALTSAGFGPEVKLQVEENGLPTLDETQQAARLADFVRATCDSRAALNITRYTWFDLWDADSSSTTNIYAHYGLLHSDLSAKPSYEQYRTLIAKSGCSQ